MTYTYVKYADNFCKYLNTIILHWKKWNFQNDMLKVWNVIPHSKSRGTLHTDNYAFDQF